MGKNQAYKAMQRARLGANAAAPEEINDGMMDGSFHSPEWHAARLASLNKSHTVTWEEYKKKQKEEEMKKGELEADKDRMMREYRAQLDAERAAKLSQGRNHSSSKSSRRKDKKDKDSKKRSSKKRKDECDGLSFTLGQAKLSITAFSLPSLFQTCDKHSRRYSDSSSSSSSSESSSSDDESRSKSRSKRRKKEKKHRSRSKQSSSDSGEGDGPLPLSRFFGSVKS